jgi:hypothetical protein
VGKLPASHRYDHLPLLPSDPGGVQQELVVQDLPAAKVEKNSGVPNKKVFLLYVCIKTNRVMENKNNSVLPLAMSHGLYMGFALVLNSAVFYVMGSPFSNYSAYISYVIVIIGIGITMRTFRDNNIEAGVSYGRALGLGTLQSLFASLIMAFFTFVLFKIVDKNLLENFLSFIEAQMLSKGTSENMIEPILSFYRKALTPLTYSLGQIFGFTFMGFFFSLILAIFFKKQSDNPFHGIE